MVFPAITAPAGATAYPYMSISSSDTSVVYAGASTFAGPFNSQYANIDGWLPDQLKVSFMSTQSKLNVQGKITVGVFYSPPTNNFRMNSAGTFDGTTCVLTSSDILNNTRSVAVYNVP